MTLTNVFFSVKYFLNMARESAPSAEAFSEEFERLKRVASTREGYESLNTAFMRALNWVRVGNGWSKINGSDGDSVAGFAIESTTGEYEIGEIGRHHAQPFLNLKRRLRRGYDDGEFRPSLNVSDGRLAHLPAWKFPLALISGGFNREALKQVESKIVEKQIGLPIRGLRDDEE